MTQLTIRNVDSELADRIRAAAKESGDSINSHLLKLLERQYSDSEASGGAHRNDLERFRKGWTEDPAFDEAQEILSTIDDDCWK